MKKAEMRGRFYWIFIMVSMLLVSSCDWPYSPATQQQPSGGGSSTTEAGIVYPVNSDNQICNPSISQNDNYPGCMLWLNFKGTLETNGAPAGWDNAAKQHDRLTISDTANAVKWFMMRDELTVEGEIQDPEWSTHPDYLVCLGSDGSKSSWDGFAVRISDRKVLKFNEDKIAGEATPHIWLPDSVTSTGEADNISYGAHGFADRESIKDFFGTYNVKIAYSVIENGLTIYYMDYNNANPSPVKLPKPSDKSDWKAESPMISPDGNWVTFNIFEKLDLYVTYVQELKAGSKPYLIEEDASAPHWWVHPVDSTQIYVVYTKLPANYFVKEELTETELQNTGAAGITVKQRLALYPGLAQHAALEKLDEAQTIVKLPFKGGLSRDGNFLCTGYAWAYLMKLY
jgi:hypothetical protein